MSVAKHDFQSRAIRLGQKSKFSDGQPFNVWSVRAELNCVRFSNDLLSISVEYDNKSNVMPT